MDFHQPREQTRFRAGYSTIDHLKAVNQLQEKVNEHTVCFENRTQYTHIYACMHTYVHIYIHTNVYMFTIRLKTFECRNK